MIKTVDSFWDQVIFWYTHSATPAVHVDRIGYFMKGSILMPSILDHFLRHICVMELRCLGSSLVQHLLHMSARSVILRFVPASELEVGAGLVEELRHIEEPAAARQRQRRLLSLLRLSVDVRT